MFMLAQLTARILQARLRLVIFITFVLTIMLHYFVEYNSCRSFESTWCAQSLTPVTVSARWVCRARLLQNAQQSNSIRTSMCSYACANSGLCGMSAAFSCWLC